MVHRRACIRTWVFNSWFSTRTSLNSSGSSFRVHSRSRNLSFWGPPANRLVQPVSLKLLRKYSKNSADNILHVYRQIMYAKLGTGHTARRNQHSAELQDYTCTSTHDQSRSERVTDIPKASPIFFAHSSTFALCLRSPCSSPFTKLYKNFFGVFN